MTHVVSTSSIKQYFFLSDICFLISVLWFVGLGWLEQPTSRLSGVRSNQAELQAQISKKIYRSYQPFLYMVRMNGKIISKDAHRRSSKRESTEKQNINCPGYWLLLYGFLQKGGDPAAPSGTATLLRLSPSHWVRLRRHHCRLRAPPTSMAWRAVCTRPGNVFTVACWSTITSDSNFMLSSCRQQSELRLVLGISSTSRLCPLYQPLYHVCSPGHKGHDDLTSSPPSSGLSPAVSLEFPPLRAGN